LGGAASPYQFVKEFPPDKPIRSKQNAFPAIVEPEVYYRNPVTGRTPTPVSTGLKAVAAFVKTAVDNLLFRKISSAFEQRFTAGEGDARNYMHRSFFEQCLP
jgi:hypothetical protein